MAGLNSALHTYLDLLDYCQAWAQGGARTKQQTDHREAIQAACRDLSLANKWEYYYDEHRVNLVAPYETGTLSYDHCVTPEHEALTRNGWKTHDQLSVGDEILAYDHDSETCSWQPIEKIHEFDYDGQILDVRRKGRTVLRCTPNHRVPVFERTSTKVGGKVAHHAIKKWVLAKDLTCEHTTPLAAPLESEDCGPLTPRLAAILSWCVTDGTAMFTKWGTPSIQQSYSANREKCEEIESLTGKPHYPSSERKECRGYPVARLDHRAIRKVASAKSDLPRLFCSFGVHQAEAAIRAMVLAEASISGNQVAFTQWGENKPVAEAFQIACLLAGKATNICEGDFRCKGFGRDYGVRRRYQCSIRTSKGIKLAKLSQWIHYTGKVWCPQVRTGAWVVRCNGAVMITGNSGGTHERLVTFSTALSDTVQTWAKYGRLLIANVVYPVDDYKSTTTVTLESTLAPTADIAAGTTFKLYRSGYPLPDDFVSLEELFVEKGFWQARYIQPSEWFARERFSQNSGRTDFWTILRDKKVRNRFNLMVTPYPSTAEPLGFIYRRRPRALRVAGTESGARTATVTGAVGADSLVTSAALDTSYVGSVIRLRDDTSNVPTGLGGQYPYDEQHIIKEISSTTVTLDGTTLEKSYSADRMVISDPLDVNESMLEALKAQVEYRLARFHTAGRDQPSLNTLKGTADREIRQAMECESRHMRDRLASYSMFDWVQAMRNATVS